MNKAFVAENGFISKIILNVQRKERIRMMERKPVPGNIIMKMEVQEVSRVIRPEK